MAEVRSTKRKVVVIGGCGHVGLPLGVKFALAGMQTALVDIEERAVKHVNSGIFPFVERDGDKQLREALNRGLKATTDPSVCKEADVVVFVTGTPVDEHLNPKISDVLKIFDSYAGYFRAGTLVVMRSTLFPGTMEHLYNRTKEQHLDIKLAFCPERVAQGIALEEIDSLPQIVSSFDQLSFDAAYELFAEIAPEIIRLTPIEAEMTKLMANSWRYLEFAIANQFYMIAESKGVDFYRVYRAVRHNYPRAAGYKAPGFAAGPCLFKDTMQLASFFDHQFAMGHSAMLVNEGLADFVVDKTVRALGGSLWGRTVGVLGMTFKANNDDIRESLSFRVKKGLEFRGARVIFNDPYLEGSVPLNELIAKSDALVLGTPHGEYLKLELRKPIIDVWGIYNQPVLEVLPGREGAQTSRPKAANE